LSAIEEQHQDPMTIFLYALKSPESKRQYPRHFKMFLDYLNLKGTIQEQAKQFLVKARANPQWAQDNLIQFQNNTVEASPVAAAIIKFMDLRVDGLKLLLNYTIRRSCRISKDEDKEQ
jgi:hypothetical protein